MDVPGDYYLDEQLEYVEMVPIRNRVDVSGNDDEDGKYVLDSKGHTQPIRTIYSPAVYLPSGKFIGSTFPDMERGNQSDEDFARNTDLSDNPAETMTVDDYVAVYKQAIEEHITNTPIDPDPWFSGERNYTVTYIDIEMDAHGLPVEVSKTESVTISKLIPDLGHSIYEENITISATLTETITSITPDDQLRNPFGLYNVHGNVAEWVDKSWDGKSGHHNHVDGDLVVVRGGSWRSSAQACRSASRDGRNPDRAYDDVGFRFVIEE